MWGASRSSLSELSDWLDAQRGAEGLAALPAELFSVADLLDRDQGWIDRGGSFHEHPALHFRGQQALQSLEFAHRGWR